MAKYLRLRGKKSGKEGYFKITLFPYPYFFLLLFIKRLGTSCADQTPRVLLVSPPPHPGSVGFVLSQVSVLACLWEAASGVSLRLWQSWHCPHSWASVRVPPSGSLCSSLKLRWTVWNVLRFNVQYKTFHRKTKRTDVRKSYRNCQCT